MKIACCGDQHWTDRSPKNRKDSYFKTVLDKLQQEVDIAIEEKCSCIIFPGDLFNSFKENHLVVQEVMYILQKFKDCHNGHIFAVAGQHDQTFHNNDLSGTPLQTLQAAKILTIIENTFHVPITNGVVIYGANWGEEIPEITTPNCVNILITHRMIVDEKLWEGQEEATRANHLLLKTKYDCIISGDNHQQFIISKNNRHVINMGSLMRSTIAQLNHHPAVVVYDTETKQVDIIDLDVRPFNEVMCLEKAEKEKEKNLKLESFIKSLKATALKEGHAVKLDFVKSLHSYVKDNKVEDGVYSILKDCLQ